MADSLDSGSSAHSGRAGSSPASRTNFKDSKTQVFGSFFVFLRTFWTICVLDNLSKIMKCVQKCVQSAKISVCINTVHYLRCVPFCLIKASSIYVHGSCYILVPQKLLRLLSRSTFCYEYEDIYGQKYQQIKQISVEKNNQQFIINDSHDAPQVRV